VPETVVIGAGVIGSSIGLELARSGRDVVVIDRGPGPGTGSTSASSACIRFHYSTWEGVALAWESKFAWTDWRGHLGVTDPTGMASYIRTGVLVLDFPGFDARRTLAFYAEAGIPVEELSAAQVRERFPTLDPGRHHPPRALDDEAFWSAAAGEIGGWWTPDGGYVDDPQLAAHNLLHAAVVQGARVRFNTTVDAIRRDGDRVCGVLLSDGSTLPADIVVNAAGPHSGVVNELAGVADEFRVRTRPLRQEVHSVPATHVPPRAASLPMVGDGDLGTYFRPQPGGGLLIGGQEPECDPLVWLDDPDRYDAEPTAASYEAQVTRVARRMPELSVPSRVRGIVGVYDVSDDWIPIYDRTSLAGYYVAIGTSGNQFKNAPAVGQLMRRLVDACESGHPHDVDPVQWTTPVTNLAVDLGHYSRLRSVNAQSSNSVLG
jgi:sarcosine oxidase subunit beta